VPSRLGGRRDCFAMRLLPQRASAGAGPMAGGMARLLAISSKLRPISAQTASFREKACQRLIAASTKRGSISMVYARRPTRSAARMVVPDPAKTSSTISPNGRSRSNVWHYAGVNSFRAGRLDELRVHPTVKPVALVADAVRDHTC
jgi:hypothetical protein